MGHELLNTQHPYNDLERETFLRTELPLNVFMIGNPPNEKFSNILVGDLLILEGGNLKVSYGLLKTDEYSYHMAWALDLRNGPQLHQPNKGIYHSPQLSWKIEDAKEGSNCRTLNLTSRSEGSDKYIDLDFERADHLIPRDENILKLQDGYRWKNFLRNATLYSAVTMGGFVVCREGFKMITESNSAGIIFDALAFSITPGVLFSAFYFLDRETDGIKYSIHKKLLSHAPALQKHFLNLSPA